MRASQVKVGDRYTVTRWMNGDPRASACTVLQIHGANVMVLISGRIEIIKVNSDEFQILAKEPPPAA